ncbi:hypothetical protein [Tropicimonas sp. IMCC34043]|uniref:hypothetical protein n=1 Tax=Tropicimonas sp. IMCC34043 TaxID=2248760 RepID=UPI000E2746CA|nr:hypothetical protein [Tropicimonas sp. IMCC34043]
MLSRRFFLATAASSALASTARGSDGVIKLRDLYVKGGAFSDLARSLEGQRITVDGFMAPPLKADLNFFVLTKMPMATCPFCESETDWPQDIVAVYTKRVVDVEPFNVRIDTRGVLELGAYKDPETGFVSLLRLTDATFS